MVLAANSEQNGFYTFKEMLLQPDKSDLILSKIKEVEAHKARSEARRHWTLMKKSESKKNYKNKYVKLKTI